MRVSVLGGTVFAGRAIVEALCAAGHDVTVVHRGVHEPDPASGYPDVEHVHADRAALPPLRCDAVVDCYAMTGPDSAAVLAALPDVPIVVLSSCDVYPMLDAVRAGTSAIAGPIDERTPLRTDRYPYGTDYEKLHCEPLYLDRGGIVLRLPFTTGPHDPQRREEWVLRHVRAGSARMEIGLGDVVVSRLHVGDVGTAVESALRTDVRGEVFVLADEPSSTAREWCEAIIEASGTTMELVTVADGDVAPDAWWTMSHAQHLDVSPAKAMRLLDWRPTPWRDAVRQSVAWHLANPAATG